LDDALKLLAVGVVLQSSNDKPSDQTQVGKNARPQNQSYRNVEVDSNPITQPGKKKGDEGVGNEAGDEDDPVEFALQHTSDSTENRIDSGETGDRQILSGEPTHRIPREKSGK
jgi:hypothetical protein